MTILLDTQCFLWMSLAPERFSSSARHLLEDRQHALYLSAASAWEIAIKHALGKLRLPEAPVSYVPARVAALGVLALPIDHRHALHVASLPPLHRDPFDRMLVAQAQIEELPIMTADPVFSAYEVTAIPA